MGGLFMLYFKLFILFETAMIVWLAWARNPDPFSPAKFYLLFSIFFYLEIYFQDVRIETLVCYFALIQAIAICVFLEKRFVRQVVLVSRRDAGLIIGFVWLLSIPPVVAMLYFVYEAGGVLAYFGVLATRVDAWKGRGAMIVLINTLPALNLVYFGSVVALKRVSFTQIFLYILHFIVFVMVGLLTASRSYIGISILGMCVVWAYLVRVPRFRHLFTVSVALVLFAGIIGGARNSYGEGMTLDSMWEILAEAKFETAQMGYGVSPMEVIFESPEKDYLWGATYMTLITNVVPRAIWPDKPNTGGLIFTKEYTDDQTGLSYLATGAVTEGVMNFGKIFGSMFGLLLNFFLFISGSILYNRRLCGRGVGVRHVDLLFVVGFYYVVLAISKFSYGEFTDVIQTLVFFNLAPLALIRVGLHVAKMKK